MSANWAIKAEVGSRKITVKWSGRYRSSYVCVVSSETSTNKNVFRTFKKVEEWAKNLGIQEWCYVDGSALPEAIGIPILFPDGPPLEKLNKAITSIKSGAKLKEVSEQLEAHPIEVKAWLFGVDPTCKEIQGWRSGYI